LPIRAQSIKQSQRLGTVITTPGFDQCDGTRQSSAVTGSNLLGAGSDIFRRHAVC
jgi:hypothetical protein